MQFSKYKHGGDEEDRTPDPLRARQVLSQLSYTPILQEPLEIFRFSPFENSKRALKIEQHLTLIILADQSRFNRI